MNIFYVLLINEVSESEVNVATDVLPCYIIILYSFNNIFLWRRNYSFKYKDPDASVMTGTQAAVDTARAQATTICKSGLAFPVYNKIYIEYN